MIVINWDEFNIFYHIPTYNITPVNKKLSVYKKLKLYSICPCKANMFNKIQNQRNISFNYIWCDILIELFHDNLFKRNMKRYILKYESKNRMNDIFSIYYKIFTDIIIINKCISNQVTYFLKKYYNTPYIGIQIRVGNEDLKERQFSNKTDIDMMIILANKFVKYKKWFITGDSQRLKLKLSKMYKNIFLYNSNITKHYAKYPKDSTIIIEHEILSKSKFLIISRSSYGLTSVLKSGLLLNSKNNDCFEIKKGNIYKFYEEFIYFYDI